LPTRHAVVAFRTMSTPAWRPIPRFDPGAPESVSEQARARALHRAIMALRWRDRGARAEDRARGRRPHDWHEWMGCPADEYQATGCTCDRIDRSAQKPANVQAQERSRRSRPLGATPSVGPQPITLVRWVQSIDTSPQTPNILGHTHEATCSPTSSTHPQAVTLRREGTGAQGGRCQRRGLRSQKRGRQQRIASRRCCRHRRVHQQARLGFGRVLPRLFGVRVGS